MICAVHKDLNPKLIEPFKLLVIKVVAGDRDIGSSQDMDLQENWEEEKRLPFLRALKEYVIKTSNAGKSFIIEIGANSKLGRQLIPGDPPVLHQTANCWHWLQTDKTYSNKWYSQV